MKRNLLSILILALLIVNIALTTVMMITVNNTSAKTAALVNDIAGVLNLEVNGPVSNYSSAGEDISLADTVTYDIAEPMTIPLAIGEDGASHFAVVSVSISMDGTDKEFKKYGVEGIASRQSLIKSEIMIL